MINVELVADGQSIAGYGAHTRLMLRALDEYSDLVPDLNVSLVNRAKELPAELTADEARLLHKFCTNVLPQTDVRVFFEPAQFAQFEPDVPTIVFSQWETDRISDYDRMGRKQLNWVAQLNKAKLVMTSSMDAVKTFRASGVETEAVWVPGPVFPHVVEGEVPIRGLVVDQSGDPIPREGRPLVVGYMAQWSPRKNIEAFVRDVTVAFSKDQAVGVLKTYRSSQFRDGAQLIEMVKTIKGSCMKPDAPRFFVIHEQLSNEEVQKFFNSIDIYYAPSHGEGFSIPVAMACAAGCDVLVPKWGGPSDYVPDWAQIGGQFSPVIGMGTYSWDQCWFDVDEKEAIAKLKERGKLVKNSDVLSATGTRRFPEMAETILNRIGPKQFCKGFLDGIKKAIA